MQTTTASETNTYYDNLRKATVDPREQIHSILSSAFSLVRNTASVAQDAFGLIKFSNRSSKALEATKFIYLFDLPSYFNSESATDTYKELKDRAWVKLSCRVAEATETVGLVLEAASSLPYTLEKVAQVATILGSVSVVFGVAHFVRDYRELKTLQNTTDLSPANAAFVKMKILAKKIDLFVSTTALLGFLFLTVGAPCLVPAASLLYFSSSVASAVNKVLPMLIN